MDAAETLIIFQAYEATDGRSESMARWLGMNKRTLFSHMRRLQISMRKLHKLRESIPPVDNS